MKKEKFIEALLAACGWLTVLTTVGILWVLFSESALFFSEVSVGEFLTSKRWTPLFAEKHFGIWPLLSGTLMVTFIAILIAFPLGITIAVYLNEYAKPKFRTVIKPFLELLAAVPTVVYGFFALIVVTPFLQSIFPGIKGFNAISPGIVIGIMIIPMIASLSEDALSAVPKSLKEGAYGLGSTRFQVAWKVTVPAASSGIIASVILALARAIGETMVVAIAAGQQPRVANDPTEPLQTITSYIVQVTLGDAQHGSVEYRSIFAAGLALFVLTFVLNNISFLLRKRFTQQYE